MNKIYDNGYYLLGRVEDILKYANKNSIDDASTIDMLNELKLYDKESMVCIGYDNDMCCIIEEFTERDIVKECE